MLQKLCTTSWGPITTVHTYCSTEKKNVQNVIILFKYKYFHTSACISSSETRIEMYRKGEKTRINEVFVMKIFANINN